MQKRVHLIFIGMIVMADLFIYLLLGLLPDGHSAYYAQGSGSQPIESSELLEGLVYSGRYIWYALNIATVVLVVYKKIPNPRKSSAKTRNVSR